MGLVLTDTSLDLSIADALYVNFPVALKNAVFCGDAFGADKANFSASIPNVGAPTRIDDKTTRVGNGVAAILSANQPQSGTYVVCFKHESLTGETNPLSMIGAGYSQKGGAAMLSASGSIFCRYKNESAGESIQTSINLNPKLGEFITVAMMWERSGDSTTVSHFCPDTLSRGSQTSVIAEPALAEIPIYLGGNINTSSVSTHKADVRFAGVANRVLTEAEITALYVYLKTKCGLY